MLLERRPQEGPAGLIFFRHLPSEYTAGRDRLHSDPQYAEFAGLYNAQFNNRNPSTRIRHLAQQLRARHPRVTPDPYPQLANPDDAKLLGSALQQKAGQGDILIPDIIVVGPALRTWETLAGIKSEFKGLTHAINTGKTIFDVQKPKKKKKTVTTDGFLTEDSRVAGRDYGDISDYTEEKIYFTLNWNQQRRLASFGNEGEYWYRPPHGQNIPDVMERMDEWKRYISGTYPGKVVWVIGQLDTILTFIVLSKELPKQQTAKEFLRLRSENKPVHGGMTTFTTEARRGKKGCIFVMQTYNQNILGGSHIAPTL